MMRRLTGVILNSNEAICEDFQFELLFCYWYWLANVFKYATFTVLQQQCNAWYYLLEFVNKKSCKHLYGSNLHIAAITNRGNLVQLKDTVIFLIFLTNPLQVLTKLFRRSSETYADTTSALESLG